MIIAIYGSASNNDPKTRNVARVLGKLIAKNGHTLITGACSGTSHEAAKAAFLEGGQVIGYSPGIDIDDHITRFSDPVECFSKLIFVPRNYEYKDNRAACYKYRNISTALHCDKAIIIGGRFGTLNEFTLAYEFGKEIGVLDNIGGAGEVIASNLISLTLNKIEKKTGAKVVIASSVSSLAKQLGL